MAIFPGSAITPAGGGYAIDQSLRFNDDDTAYLSRTPASAGNRKTWTFSFWMKGAEYTNSQTIFSTSLNYDVIRYQSTGELLIYLGNGDANLATSMVFRDPSAWYHITVAVDTTQATASNRVKLYVNGEQITAFVTSIYPSQNYDTGFNNSIVHAIGRRESTSSLYYDGYLAEVHFIDGQALDPSYFGETDEDYGHWKPIAYTGSYGTNGFYLDFSNSASPGEDQAGSNDWTANNLAATDVVLDSPTNNFATLNPLKNALTLSEGSLKGTASFWSWAFSTFGISSGKWYWEQLAIISGNNIAAGVRKTSASDLNYDLNHANSASYDCYVYTSLNGWKEGQGSGTSYGATYAAGDIIGVALDMDAGTITFYKNNSSQGTAFTGITEEVAPVNGIHDSKSAMMNFGQDSSFAGNKTAQNNTDDNGVGDFYYAPPSGFLALCTANLPDPAVVPGENFNTVLYGGTGSTQSITGVGFQPDFTWIKGRSYGEWHALHNVLSGTGKFLKSHATDAEVTDRPNCLTSFDSDGFTVGNEAVTNSNSQTYVAWNWKADNTSGSSNTDGSITSTVAANTDAGFSIVSYTGTGSNATVGHGLSSAPEIVITKNRDYAVGWAVLAQYANSGSGQDGRLFINETSAYASNTEYWNDTSPTSSVFSVGVHNTTNRSGDNMIAYCFHSVDGFSKFGSYTGNGSSDGAFVYTGFRPAFVMVKRTDTTSQWSMWDSARNTYNVAGTNVWADSSEVEVTSDAGYGIDLTSNGFKLRNSHAARNASGGTYIYMAFAEFPFSVGGGIAR